MLLHARTEAKAEGRESPVKEEIMIWVRSGEAKRELVQATVWHGECPPDYKRGRNRKMKSRRYKQARMRKLVEDALD